MKIKLFPFALLVFALALFSCEDASVSDSSMTETSSTLGDEEGSTDEETNQKVQDILHSVPSPMDMAAILKKAGATYDPDYLNPVKSVNEYTTAQQQALNLGVYGGDLSYASVFNQNQESILYLSCTKKLADKLGLSKAFNDEVIERMELNLDNRDSLLSIISETYYNLDSYLKENDRGHVSAIIIGAGWIEGLYLGTQIASHTESPSAELLQRIAEQKVSLENLVALVDAYNTSNGNLAFLLEDLEAISAVYESISVYSTDNSITEGDDGVTTIGGPIMVDFSDEDLNKLAAVVATIRTRYIQF